MGGQQGNLAARISTYFAKRSQQPYQPWQVVISIACGATVELVIIPGTIVMGGKWLDQVLGLAIMPNPLTRYVGGLLILAGFLWLGWSIIWQHWHGRGTPLPLVPTRVLLTTGPYRYCRNPMAFGAILWLSGLAIAVNSPSALIGGVGLFAAGLLLYIHLIEERELAIRFRKEYEQYRRRTPLLIPRLLR
jgi:protein-S-isoprenylcysteine O-methyltransferase Ste14